jgi:hypothetical protein
LKTAAFELGLTEAAADVPVPAVDK